MSISQICTDPYDFFRQDPEPFRSTISDFWYETTRNVKERHKTKQVTIRQRSRPWQMPVATQGIVASTNQI